MIYHNLLTIILQYHQKSSRTKNSYAQRINSSNMRTRRKPQKLCPDCKETNDCNKIEEVIDNFHENPIKPNKVNSFSIFNAKFTLINELEYIFRKPT
ncbi:unnamed protein product [Rhizophagus irregularis]|nr:unnamed protein product [Rhizophagus irregularis]